MSKQSVAERIWVVGPYGESNKLEKKPLKDISNRLEAQPIILKPGRTGLCNIFEKLNKGGEEQVGIIIYEANIIWPNHFESPLPPRHTTSMSNAERAGLHETRPHDLTCYPSDIT